MFEIIFTVRINHFDSLILKILVVKYVIFTVYRHILTHHEFDYNVICVPTAKRTNVILRSLLLEKGVVNHCGV